MTVLKTGGGAFDPDKRGIMFAAAGTLGEHVGTEYYLVAVNDLYGKHGEDLLKRLIDKDHKVLLDSGIFNLTNEHKRATGCTMDEALALQPHEINGFDRLFDRYVELATRYGDDLWGYIELDQGGPEGKRKTRKILQDEGLVPIPVYHPIGDGWDYFDELAQSYDRICFGNVVQASLPTRERFMHTLWERHRQYPDLWVHILGLTANDWCLPFPPDSCDSSTWINGRRYPSVSLGSSMLRRTGQITDPGFRYCYDSNGADGPRGADEATKVYRDEVEYINMLWSQITEINEENFGVTRMPERMKKEGRLEPATKPN